MTDDVPGDFDSVDGIKRRAEHFDNRIIPVLIDGAEERIVETEDGYSIAAPEAASDSMKMLFHFGILTGAAMEREYPASIDGGETE